MNMISPCKGHQSQLPVTDRQGWNTVRTVRSYFRDRCFIGAVFCLALLAPQFAVGAEPVSVLANQATPSVTNWPTATAITYGETLAASTLTGGAASVGGSFAFTTPGTIPGAGTAAQAVTFTPTDTASYNSVTGSVSVLVNQATPTVTTWPTATSIEYGQTLASSTLSGGSASVEGSFAFTTPGTIPSAGTAAQAVTFTPTDTANYNTVNSTVSSSYILKHTGYFGPTTTLNGVALGAETAFTIHATFDTTTNLAPVSAGPGLGVYAATASFEISGKGTYQSAPGADLSVWLLSPSQDKSFYAAGIANRAGDPAEFGIFDSATPHFTAGAPTATIFSDWTGSFPNNPSFSILLGDGTSTLMVDDLGEGTATAEVIVVPGQETGSEVTVNQSVQIITFGTLPVMVYGDAPFTLTASASSGLPVSYVSADTTVATVTGNTVSILKAGSTLLTASQTGNINYLAATNVSQTLTVDELQMGLNIHMETNAAILILTGNLGREYSIYYTDALTNADWLVLTTITNLPFSPYSYTNLEQKLPPSRFYRAQHPVWIQPPE